MKKYKKIHQRRKKYKRTGPRKIRRPGHSKPPSSTARKKAVRLLVIAAILCAAAAGFVSIKYLWRVYKKPKTSSSQTQDLVLLPVREPIRSEQEFAALKKEELELADKLMSEFLGNENSLMIMGNVWNRYGDAVQALKSYKTIFIKST